MADHKGAKKDALAITGSRGFDLRSSEDNLAAAYLELRELANEIVARSYPNVAPDRDDAIRSLRKALEE